MLKLVFRDGYPEEHRKYYFHGNLQRLAKYLVIPPSCTKLEIKDLLNLEPSSVILTSRAWSPVLEILVRYFKNRPYVIQAADGIVTELNSTKPINRRYGGLYKINLFDALIVAQDVKTVNQENTTYSCQTYKLEMGITREEALDLCLVFGNDPFLGLKFRELQNLLSRFFTFLPRNKRVFISCPNLKLRKWVTKNYEHIKPLMNVSELTMATTVIVGGPSTFLFELASAGFSCCRIDFYKCRELEVFFPSALDFFSGEVLARTLSLAPRLEHVTIEKSKRTIPIDLNLIFKYLLGDFWQLTQPYRTFLNRLKG